MKKHKKSPKRKPLDPQKYTLLPTQTEAGVAWLSTLDELTFRDKILEHLFRKMQKEGQIEWFEKIHGRNDKGVDFLLVHQSELGRRILGIQVKSKPITRSGSDGGVLRIKQECIAAMEHEFEVQGNPARIDNIELWCSAHITPDAEQEFYAPGAAVKVQVKKPSAIFTLIEKYSAELLRNAPQCALALYINDKKNPPSKGIRLLGCELNPKIHFLEPHFSRINANSVSSLTTENNALRKVSAPLQSLSEILFSTGHSVLLASELSGKTYLLEHGLCLVADAQAVPLFLDKDDFAEKPSSIYSLISHRLGFYSSREVEMLANNVRIYLLVDNIDRLTPDIQQMLFSQDAQKIKIVGTARSLALPDHVNGFHMSGVNLGSITKFLRSLDRTLSESKAFIDRAHSFIGRSLESSGLPSTPFAISIMLAECQASDRRFNTPTMGRLIERFVEMQLGSHSDNIMAVDFETKREFLTKLAGRNESSIPLPVFRRELIKFLESRLHPHSIDDFIADLHKSGVIKFTDDKITWSHPVIKQFYWVKNLISRKKLNPIIGKLREEHNVTLAALVGSQIKDAGSIADELIEDLKHIRLPSHEKVLKAAQDGNSIVWASDEQEEAWLSELETSESTDQKKHPVAEMAESNLSEKKPSVSVDEKTPESVTFVFNENTITFLRKKLEPLMMELAQSKLHIAFNLAAMLVNARDTRADSKAATIRQIIACNIFLADWMQKLFKIALNDEMALPIQFEVARLCQFLQLSDQMMGDPFLVNVFKGLLKSAKTDDEILAYVDLVLCCGEEDYSAVIEKLKSLDRPEMRFALYLRVAVLYFFRFHRASDKKALRHLLQGIRKMEKGIQLPHVK